ncbi:MULTISPECIES: PulJ/GspJ family protein [Paenibacillus]|uniref:PulJ/GspJ family protein n=1 Tax=Paenibacillus TaxID=44249 RepID=UPI0022B90BA9|nr:prepilin-type cleavage/methylation domain-containing protein [Paenibacillus caseinilyticus]MCZ8519769.1 prepilin-type cleavage/methylation domain-containing protein [Paenibacillus caseinilyticus]
MNIFVKRLRDERGLTLIELIAMLSIMSMVMGTIYGVITFGFNAYHRVTIENELRNEGDILMSSIMTEMYAFGPDSMAPVQGSDGIKGLALVKKNDRRYILLRPESGGAGYSLYIGDQAGGTGPGQVPLRSKVVQGPKDSNQDSSIVLECSTEACESGLVSVRAVLSQTYNGGEQTLALQSKFGF